MAKKFGGVINLDIRDSVPDWTPYTAERAPDGSPNVLIILFDDTGMAAWSPYGGRISMPTMDKLAATGLTYTQWHTTALCSPTRSSFLTGRTHHQNGFASISEGATGYPGANSHIPMENAFLAEVLREKGWNTFWVGKNHNVPIDEWHAGASKRNWPLARGFDRFYGFLGGETNQWYPDLTEDNHNVDQPYLPDDGYHLSKDLADKAIEFIRDSQQTAPEKPWYMFFCPGANHAPHHAPQEWIDKYKGQFDDGYEAYREWVLPRMIERGILPEGTDITEINPMPDGTFAPADSVRPWETLSADEKALFARMAEVYAGFSSYTDYETGRIIDYLEESGQLDNTIVMFAADNGASGEGSPDGSVNEGKFFNGIPDDIAQNLTMLDKLGSPDTYNHYPTGWAMAFSTPFRMFKRYSYQGGVADPLVISWPKGIKARGEVRTQYHHVTDIVPTLLEALGVEFPEVVNGYTQTPLPGVSMAYTFDSPEAPTTKQVQYYEMLGTRALWHEGWKVVALHGPTSGIGHFEKDVWQLFHTDEDRSEAVDLADQYPDKVAELVALWFEEAGKYNVLPLNDLTAKEILAMEIPTIVPPGGTYTYYAGASDVPERMAANVHGVSYTIAVEFEATEADAEGVLFAQGSRFGGHSLFVKNRKLYYAYNFLGIPPETQFISDVEVGVGKHVAGLEFAKESVGEYGVSIGTAKLYLDKEVVAEGPLTTMTGHFSLCGEGLAIGRDSGDPVSKEYDHGFDYRGGTIVKAQVHVGDDAFLDMERMLEAAMARD